MNLFPFFLHTLLSGVAIILFILILAAIVAVFDQQARDALESYELHEFRRED